MPRGKLLETMTWQEAEVALTADVVVVIPLGAAAKEHGPHLRLNNDWQIAEYLKEKLLESENVVVAPTVPYSFYPSFVEYPGSITLELGTARDTIIQICTSLAAFGPRRFYVLNTGISTLKALAPAAEALSERGILLHFTNIEELIAPTVRELSEQEGGSHADEIETSMMLVIAPQNVDMSKAVKDFDKTGRGRLSRSIHAGFTYSPTGIWGDASLASAEKGEAVVKSLLAGVINDLQKIRQTALPSAEHEKNPR